MNMHIFMNTFGKCLLEMLVYKFAA